MKKLYILTAVLALLTLSLNAQDLKVDQNGNVVQPKAKTGKVNAPNRAATQVTVCDGTRTNYYVPFYGLYFDDNYQIDQMIYPESLLTNLVGKTITSVTFYANSNFSSNIGSGKFTFKIGTTNQTTFSSPITRITTGMTAVATNMTMSNCISGSQLIIDFSDNPFTYQGGNLVLDYELTTLASGYNSTAFYGQNNHTNASFYGYSSSSSTNNNGVYSNSSTQNFLPKVTFGAEDSGPKIVVSPETLTINDSGTNNTFTVVGTNLGTDDVGVTVPNGSQFSTTTDDQYWGFENNNGSVSGTVTVTYDGRDLSATETVSVGNNLTSTTVAVNYRADLYIVGNFGSGWDFSTGTQMTYNSDDNTYTATVTVDANNLFLFARKLVNNEPWGTRLVFGPNSDGDWVLNGDSGSGAIDLYDDDPIKIVNAGTYTVTINASTGALTIEKLVLPPPENVDAVADSGNQSATVTWDAPSNLPKKSVTEDFEDTSVFPPFSTGGVTATQHTGAFGEWTLYDATGGCVVYGSKQLNYDNESDPHAWFVFAPSGATADQDYPNAVAHDSYSGAQYLESICPQSSTTAEGVSDHWLISPELSGNAQTISFYVSEMTTQYSDETYEIWVSTTDNDPSSFSKLGGTYNVSLDTWAEQTVQLPAGTKYFAIRHTSEDIFGLLIDDVAYEGVIKPVSYKIYLDGQYVATVPATTDPLSYDFGTLAAGTHTASVSAVYPDNVESAATPSNQFTIMGKTDAPVISVTPGDAAYTITATAADPTAEVILTIDGVDYTGTGSVSYTVNRGTENKTVEVSATAQESGKLVSDPAEQTVNVPMLPITPTPSIDYEQTNSSIIITATGEGTVYLEVDGRIVSGEGSVSITVMRSLEDRTVTATATAVATNHQPSAEATANFNVPALTGTPAVAQQGLLRMHLLIVDQLRTDERFNTNSHPDQYGYVLKWEQPANVEDHKQSAIVDVDIHKTEGQVNGYYTLDEIDADKNIGRYDADNDVMVHDQGLTMDVLIADMSMFLPGEDPDVLYYQLQGKEDEDPGLNKDYLTQLQYMKNVHMYEEMLEGAHNKTHQYPAEETYHYYDDWTTPILTGNYNDDFFTYAPSVSTWGVQRRYFEVDGLDNTYGAPTSKVSVGRVKMNDGVDAENKLKAERQVNQWNSVNWTDKDNQGNDAPASLYILDNVVAVANLPHTSKTNNVEYEPYMFRIFVESKNGKLRPYRVIDAVEGSATQGEHLDAVDRPLTDADKHGPLCVWSGYIQYDNEGEIVGIDPDNGVTVGVGSDNEYPDQQAYTFTKKKVDREGGSDAAHPSTWDKDANNAMFGALDDLEKVGTGANDPVKQDELNVFVRFYYNVKGMADGHVVNPNNRDGGSGDPAGYGSESPGKAPSNPTAVAEILYRGEIVSQTYYNIQGMESDKPFDGVNMVVTRYSDGSTTVTKILR